MRGTLGDIVSDYSVTPGTTDIESTSTFLRANGIVYTNENGKGRYYERNAHGDVVILYNDSGNTSANVTYQYDAFGVARKDTGSSSNPFRYTGEYYDGETGLLCIIA